MNDGSSQWQPRPVIPKMLTERPDDDLAVVWEVNLRLRRNGAMSIEGALGDREFVLAMLDNAREAVLRQIPATGLVLPPGDVAVPEFTPVKG